MRVRCGVSCGGACELIADGGTLGGGGMLDHHTSRLWGHIREWV